MSMTDDKVYLSIINSIRAIQDAVNKLEASIALKNIKANVKKLILKFENVTLSDDEKRIIEKASRLIGKLKQTILKYEFNTHDDLSNELNILLNLEERLFRLHQYSVQE